MLLVFCVIMKVTMKNGLFWDLAPYSFVERHQSFRGKCFPHNRCQSLPFYTGVANSRFTLNVSLTVHHELTIQNYQRDTLNIIYSSNIITLLYMFRVSSTHLQEDIDVHKQHMVPSLSIIVLVSC